jgi:hypothetical protein
MANMSYCQFENTLQDLYQLRNVLREAQSMEELLQKASEYEQQAIKDMPGVLAEMLRFYDIFNNENIKRPCNGTYGEERTSL